MAEPVPLFTRGGVDAVDDRGETLDAAVICSALFAVMHKVCDGQLC